MIVDNWTSSDFDEVFKELQARRAADVELMTVLEKHADANPPNAAVERQVLFWLSTPRQRPVMTAFTYDEGAL